jgi:hypothetical protein
MGVDHPAGAYRSTVDGRRMSEIRCRRSDVG